MTDTTINGHQADTIPIQTKPFDPYTAPLRADTPPDAVPEQASDSTLVADLPQVSPDATPDDDQAPDEPRRRFHRVRTVAEHPATRATARHAWHVGDGARLAVRHRRDEKTTARHHRMMAAAEAKGDHATVALWEEKAAKHRAERHARRMELLRSGPHAVKTAGYVTAASAGVLLLIGVCLAVADKDPHEVDAPLMTAVDVIRTVITLASILWAPAVLVAMFAGVVALWGKSRRHAVPPAWLAPAGTVTVSAAITPSSLVVALRELGLADLKTKIKAMGDNGAMMLGPIASAGCGIEVDVYLPGGVSTAEIQARRQKLAENLGRHRHELFITIPERAHTVRLWIADSGALDEPIGPSPLVTDPSMKADYFKGRAPWGQSLRGDRSTVSLFQRHILVAGISNQGKTASLRALILWLALDRRVRIWLADFKGVGDWSMLQGIAEVLIQGPTDEHVMAGTHMAEAGVVEMQKRTTLMQELTAKGWSQEKILADPRFAPLVLVFDEAQKAYGSSAVGEDRRPYGGKGATSRYFQAIKAIHDQGRAVNVTTAEGVQDPTNENLPVRTREGNHIRCSLVVGTESQSVMALGENAVNAGAAPHELRQGADKGTLVIAGDITAFDAPSGQVYTTIRTHYIGADDAIAIADRAKALRKPVTTRGADGQDDRPKLDVLADVAALLGGAARMKVQEVMQRLAEQDERYREWTNADFKAAMDEAGAENYPYNGVTHVHGGRVRAALARRFSASDDDQ